MMSYNCSVIILHKKYFLENANTNDTLHGNKTIKFIAFLNLLHQKKIKKKTKTNKVNIIKIYECIQYDTL